ncbi:response regulator transcription factor [Streptomyces solisilvae]|uniref:response regulator transcription factor n=1 Tax=Streptomyces malaysiensis TaxID=92644 RepID=UPI0036AE4FD2
MRRLLDNFDLTPRGGDRASERLAPLSPREVDVLRRISQGSSNMEIAFELAVSEATVKTHVSSLLKKLGLRNRVEAALLAKEEGVAAFITASAPGHV